jgi:hypothetical protein
VLQEALLLHVRENKVYLMQEKSRAISFEVIGNIVTPDGRNPSIKTVWYIDKGKATPKFVTAHPKK